MAAITVAILMIGCADGERNAAAGGGAGGDQAADASGNAVEAGTSAAGGDPESAGSPGSAPGERTLVFLGTSLTAGYGLSPDQAFPALIDGMVRDARLPFRVVNAGVSGETSAGALRRVDWLLQQPFDVLVIETGANDMLRGIDPVATRENIQAMVDRVQARRPDARIVLAGMLAMPNLGPEYTASFEALYPEIAERNGLTLIPFLLEGVAAVPELNQADGMHPTARGQRIIAETVWGALEPVLWEVAG